MNRIDEIQTLLRALDKAIKRHTDSRGMISNSTLGATSAIYTVQMLGMLTACIYDVAVELKTIREHMDKETK